MNYGENFFTGRSEGNWFLQTVTRCTYSVLLEFPLNRYQCFITPQGRSLIYIFFSILRRWEKKYEKKLEVRLKSLPVKWEKCVRGIELYPNFTLEVSGIVACPVSNYCVCVYVCVFICVSLCVCVLVCVRVCVCFVYECFCVYLFVRACVYVSVQCSSEIKFGIMTYCIQPH